MLILALDAALGGCSVAVVADDVVLAEQRQAGARGQAAMLAPMVESVLAAAVVQAVDLDAIAVTVGPGSFTGLRAALALAHGLGAALGRPVVGVTVAEALAEAVGPLPDHTLWTAIDSRRDHVFLDIAGHVRVLTMAALPRPTGPIALAGDAASATAAQVIADGGDALLTDARVPIGGDVARVARRRLAGALPPLAAQPLYIDPPEAKAPAGGLRPPPA